MGTYGISYLDDDDLAGGQDFMFVDLRGDSAWIFYRESALTPTSLEDSWAAYRALLDERGEPEPKAQPDPLRHLRAL